MKTLRCAIRALIGVVLVAASAAEAGETVGTFTLDGLSFISFGDQQILFPRTGSLIRFHFADPDPDGSVAFTIAPADVALAPIALPGSSGTLEYSITAATSGTLVPTADGRQLTFTATVRALLTNQHGSHSYEYVIPFTTGTATAASADGSQSVSATGVKVVDVAMYGQLVGATTNRTQAFPEPGSAVYAVLSGQFDQLP